MYIQRKLRLSDGQERKLARAAGKGEGLKLRLSAAQLAPGAGGIPVSLTTMRDKSVSAAPALLKPLGIGALTGAAGFGAQGLLRKMTGQGLRLGPSSGRGLNKTR